MQKFTYIPYLYSNKKKRFVFFFYISPIHLTSKVTVRKQNESFSVYRNRALIAHPHFIFKSHVVGGELNAINLAQI